MLTQDEIKRGMTAILKELGQEKGRLFLAAVSRGALDRYFPARATAFIRQNPELVDTAAKAFGAFLGQLAKSGRRRTGAPALEAVVGLIGAGTPQPPKPGER